MCVSRPADESSSALPCPPWNSPFDGWVASSLPAPLAAGLQCTVVAAFAARLDRAMQSLSVRVLGEFDVDGVEPQALGSRKARTLVRLLALARGRPVSGDVLASALWGDAQPTRPADQLAVLVSRLRAVIGRDRLERGDGGYRLHYDWLDADELADLVEEISAGSGRATSLEPRPRRASRCRWCVAMRRRSLLSMTGYLPGWPNWTGWCHAVGGSPRRRWWPRATGSRRRTSPRLRSSATRTTRTRCACSCVPTSAVVGWVPHWWRMPRPVGGWPATLAQTRRPRRRSCTRQSCAGSCRPRARPLLRRASMGGRPNSIGWT